MVYRLSMTTVWITMLIMLTGCWDMKSIQDINYATCLGFDYKDNEYTVYAQLLDFSTVAKTEPGKPIQPIPVWVGNAKGESIASAMNDLYHSSQLSIFYGHVNTIVLGENLLKKGLKEVHETLGRYYEFRYTPWMFGTQQPINKLFATIPFFNLSPLMSLIHQPKEIFKQHSIISPLNALKFTSDMREPEGTVLLPALSLDKGSWQAGEQPHSTFDVDGVFVFKNGTYMGKLQSNQVMGLRWMDPKTHRSPLFIHTDGELQASLSLERPEPKITPNITGNEVFYDMEVKLTGYISELIHPIPIQILEGKAARLVEAQIRQAYTRGLSMNADLFNLQHEFYRQKKPEWKRLRGKGEIKLSLESLKNVKVQVELIHSGDLKY
ncbi:Ger(x)C family spore germination protein [Paenibacillus cremeus]|uniref:Ger(X)C family spore germination protein n=1 Tax=Paenibacillus cremeus TaxID=2163881 RepID=A0A559K4L1_9BACL|nr:Ger(x)C family spore germination protein [Paenibacillus cremeus]TVY07056.1 Ger(x)C family spore germination protein [Paenibacillus cremeus]